MRARVGPLVLRGGAGRRGARARAAEGPADGGYDGGNKGGGRRGGAAGCGGGCDGAGGGGGGVGGGGGWCGVVWGFEMVQAAVVRTYANTQINIVQDLPTELFIELVSHFPGPPPTGRV